MEFIETPNFTELAAELLSDEELRTVQTELGQNPTKGDVIVHCGGARKIRVAGRHKGKRGGMRAIYYFQDRFQKIWFLFLYEKSHKKDLSNNERKTIRQVVEAIKETTS